MCNCIIFSVPIEVEELIITSEDGTTSSCQLPGRNVTLTCVTKGGYPRPMIIFKKDDQEILNRVTRHHFDQVLCDISSKHYSQFLIAI